MAHPHRGIGGGHPLIPCRPILRAGIIGVSLLGSGTGSAAAVSLAPVDAFSKAWKKIAGSPKSALSDLKSVASRYPELSDLASYGQAIALRRLDPGLSNHLYDSLSGLTGNPLAVLAHESISELRYLGSTQPDTMEIEAIQDALNRDLRSAMRIRLQKKLLTDLAAARRFASAESLFLVRLSGSVSLKEIHDGLAAVSPDTGFATSETLRYSLAKALLTVERSDSALALIDSLAVRRNLTSPEWILKGRIYLELGKAAEAIAAFRKAAEDPAKNRRSFGWPKVWSA